MHEQPPPKAPRLGLRAPREGRWEVRRRSLDAEAWARAVTEAERAFRTRGVHDDPSSGRRWSQVGTHRRVVLTAVSTPEGAVLAVTVGWPPPRPWVPALAWLCLPTAFVAVVVLLSRASPRAEWLAALGLVAVPVVAAVGAWVAAWIRHGATRWRIRRVLRVAAPEPGQAMWVEAEEVAEDPEPWDARLPGAVGPAEWLSADELVGLLDARPARVASADLRHARRVVVRTTAEQRASVPLPDGFTEWRPRTTS